jgi:magnesium transporter
MDDGRPAACIAQECRTQDMARRPLGDLMINVYQQENGHLVAKAPDSALQTGPSAAGLLWLDLLHPTHDENHHVEQALGLAIPTQEQAADIEVSARLYHEAGAEFMTMTAVAHLDTDAPQTTPITFVLKDDVLVTIRYAEPKAFRIYAARAQKTGSAPCSGGEDVMLGLVETMIGRMADTLERVGRDLEQLSREIFRRKAADGKTSLNQDFQSVIVRLGAEGDLLAMVRESLVSLNRLLAYHTVTGKTSLVYNKDAAAWVADLNRDATALSDHASYLTNKINFLLDATLGLINLEQNQIIKLFSIAAVVLLPPTLVATVYGMNFRAMPELDLWFGYPLALSLMAITAVIPFVWFRRRGWL